MNNVLIIGCGSIGAMKPDEFDSPTTENILTHAHAITVHPEFNLYGVLDVDKDKVIKAVERWKCFGFTHLDQVDESKVDIVVIASPTETHYEVYQQIKNWNLKAIIIEKPCGDNLYQCQSMKGDSRIIVNYTRRFAYGYASLAFAIRDEKILSCVINYVRGLKRDGCHALDLCRFIFGEILEVKKLSTGPDDYSKDDTTDCVWMKAERCPNILMVPGDGRIADHFDFQILTNRRMYNIFDHGTNVYSRAIRPDEVYGNYNSLSGEQIFNWSSDFGKTGLMSLYDYVDEIVKGRENDLCTIDDAIKVHEIIEEVRR